MSAPLVSVVVPVLWDTPELEQLLETLEGQRPTGVAPVDEVIVVNGDPTDRTIERQRSRFPHVQWTTSSAGRGRQMNTGAALAAGRWLLFLHADTCPAAGWLEEIRRADADADVVGGAFRFTLRSSARIARLVEWGVAWRVRWLGLPYGDQGLVVRRAAFDALHGFKALPIMEDVDFVRRLRRYGRIRRLRTHIHVSARRWERDGWARRTILNLLLLGLYYAGVSPARLERIYYGPPVERRGTANGDQDAHDRSHAGGADATGPRVGVVMPALNEEEAIEQVLTDIPGLVTSVTVVDNGSTDATATRARVGGARVVAEPRRGYGRACLAGLRATPDVDVVVFLDADRSDYPEEITELVSPILAGRADFVMGDRSGAARPMAARLGTSLCVGLINLLWRTDYRDLGPFRAIRRDALDNLAMTDQTWGWTIEMQIKAAEAGLRVLEVPIRQRPRIGQSKISGTFWGTVRAGTRMLVTIWSLCGARGALEVAPMTRTARPIVACGAGLAIVLVMVARLDARAETATFLGLLGVAAAIYVAALYLVAHRPPGSSRALAGCLLLALVWRVTLMAGAPLVSDDVYRYIWDGRVQQFGHNPYESVPDDPALAHLHTEPTALIDPTSAALPTIYPPAAQLFFRGVTTLHDSVTMMVTAIVLCDLLTALVLWCWLMLQRRNPWWMLAYAWHPLVALEGAGGGHIDIVGTLLIVAAAYALSARRPLVASLALAVAFSVKFLPVVLIPLLWDRVRCRDIVMAVGVVVLLYLPFSDGLRPPVGSLGVYAEQWRFNGPFFAWIELLTGTVGAVVIAVGGGVAVAAVARVRLAGDAPEAWAWPMATTLFLLPTVYPWYLVWLTPFLTTRGTWPLAVWCLASLVTYVVWASELGGAGWVLPAWVQPLEYGLVAGVGLAGWFLGRRRDPPRVV